LVPCKRGPHTEGQTKIIKDRCPPFLFPFSTPHTVRSIILPRLSISKIHMVIGGDCSLHLFKFKVKVGKHYDEHTSTKYEGFFTGNENFYDV